MSDMKTHLAREERRELGYYLSKRYSLRQIARLLGRSVSTISEEIKRNKVKGVYDPEKADHKAYVRRKDAKYQGMKIEENRELRDHVHQKIGEDWSPELIAGRSKQRKDPFPSVSAKGIYRYLHSVYGRQLESQLRYGRKKRRSYGSRKASPLINRRFIEQRQKIIEQRLRFGDYEADFIESGKNGSGYLLVAVERKSRYVSIRRIGRKTETEVFATLQEIVGLARGTYSLTVDNDIVFRNHEELARTLGIPVFFTHPYHAWEKGQVEQINKLIRQYVPKGSDISDYAEAYIKMVETKLNTRPRKCLQFRTPEEVLHTHTMDQMIKKTVVPIKNDPVGCSV